MQEHKFRHFKAAQLISPVVLADFKSLFSSYIVKITFKLIKYSNCHKHTFIQYKEQTPTQKDFPPLAANLPQNIGLKLFNKFFKQIQIEIIPKKFKMLLE